MSQSQSCLQEKLRKKLEAVKSEEPGTDWVRELVEWLYQEMLEMEFTEHLSASHYERTADRQGYRNGYRERELHTRRRDADPSRAPRPRGEVLHSAVRALSTE